MPYRVPNYIGLYSLTRMRDHINPLFTLQEKIKKKTCIKRFQLFQQILLKVERWRAQYFEIPCYLLTLIQVLRIRILPAKKS